MHNEFLFGGGGGLEMRMIKYPQSIFFKVLRKEGVKLVLPSAFGIEE